MSVCRIVVKDEVWCNVSGLTSRDQDILVNKYAIPVKNAYFNPTVQLGAWDGKQKFFYPTGNTYNYLLPEIFEIVTGMGYDVDLIDQRTAVKRALRPATAEMFSQYTHQDSTDPVILAEHQIRCANAALAEDNGLIIACTGAGKALAMDAKVLTPKGWVLNESLRVGDQVVRPNGGTANIIGVYPQTPKQLYRVTFHDGSSVECCGEHLWDVYAPMHAHTTKTKRTILNTDAIVALLESGQRGNISIPVMQPHITDDVALPLDPYVVGVLIGDGCLVRTPMITTADSSVLDAVRLECERLGVVVRHIGRYDYRLTALRTGSRTNALSELLKAMHLYGKRSYEKTIPSNYLNAGTQQRWALLQGLMDTDGTMGARNASFTTTSETLATQVQQLVWSLGGTCSITKRTPAYTYKGEKRQGRMAYTCFIAVQTPRNLFRLERKRERAREVFADGRIPLTRRVASVTPTRIDVSQCIMLDSEDHLYITDDYIVTHNTLMTAAMCDSLTHAGLNTIVIVPSVDLIANTRDELAAVGVVTGEYSGERKDLNHRVVVSTWQSLKNTPLVMKQFTAVIVDETHGAKAAELKKLLVEYGTHIAYRYGMTGTLPDDKCEALTVHVALGPVREEVSAAELIEKGWLATLDIEVLELTEDMHPQYNQFLTELKAKKTFGPPPTYKEFVKTYFPDYQSEKAYLIDKQDRIEWIANYLDAMRQAKGNTFVLVTSIPFGKALAKLIPNATFVHGSDKSKIRKQVYSLFNEHDDLVVIGTVNIAAVGINIKRIFNLVLIDLGKSFIRTIQSIGRGLRRGRGKTHLHVKDITSNLKYSTKHTKDRMKFYTAASYPNKKVRIDY